LFRCNYLNLLPGSLTLQKQTAPSLKRYSQWYDDRATTTDRPKFKH